MATSKKFSELPAASSVGNDDLFAIAHEDALAETGYVSQKLTAAQAGQKVNGDTEYPTSLPSFPENGQNPFAALEKLNSDIDALYPVNTASGSIANFTTSLVKPLTALSSTIVAQQAGTGTPSPSNPRSISGFDTVHFNYVDFNQLIKNGDFVETANWSQQRVSLSVLNNIGSVTLTDTNDPYIDQKFTSLANHKYLYCINVKRANSNANARVVAYYNGTSNNKTYTTSTDNWEQAFLIVDNTTSGDNRLRITELGTKTVGDTFQIKKAMVFDLTQMFGSTIADYIYTLEQGTAGAGVALFRKIFYKDFYAYNEGGSLVTVASVNGDTYPDSCVINLGQTVYGGSADCIGGRVINTGAKLTLNGDISTSDLRLMAQTGFTQIEWYPYRAIGKGTEVFKCDKFEFNIEKGLYRVSNNNLTTAPRMFFGLPDTVTTREEAVAWFASNPTEIVYELATPVEITGLTTNNFTTIAGENNIFSDCGEVTVQFKQNIQEYIDAKIAETQALIL